jgi:tRNA(Ile)-lysidine synthase
MTIPPVPPLCGFEAGVLKGLGALSGGMTLLAAVSGGADSSAMLLALSRLRGAGGFALRVAHVEHGIRPAAESRGDARAVRELCAALDLPCRVLTIPAGAVARYALSRGTGIEAAARRFRYRLLWKEAARRGAGALVTAHTGDDALELALMRILRGSGPGGLRPMPSRRNFPDTPGPALVLRPLLAFSRADVEAYLKERGIPWRTDTTNADERFLRNRIRLSLIPLLDEKFAGWRGGLRALGDTQALAADLIEAESRRRLDWDWVAPRRPGGPGGELRCPADAFWGEPPILREEALFRGLGMFLSRRGGGTRAVKRRNLRRFAAGELRQVDLGFCGIAVIKKPPPGFIVIFRRKSEAEAGFSLLIKEPGLYKLKFGDESGTGGTAFLRVSGTGKGRGFFAALPLAFHPASGDDVVPHREKPSIRGPGNGVVYAARDAAGLAALVVPGPGGAVILRQREFPPPGEIFFCDFCDIGGIDA